MQSFVYIEPSEEDIDPLTKQIASRIRRIPENIRGPVKGVAIGKHLEGKESQLSGLLDELILGHLRICVDIQMDQCRSRHRIRQGQRCGAGQRGGAEKGVFHGDYLTQFMDVAAVTAPVPAPAAVMIVLPRPPPN